MTCTDKIKDISPASIPHDFGDKVFEAAVSSPTWVLVSQNFEPRLTVFINVPDMIFAWEIKKDPYIEYTDPRYLMCSCDEMCINQTKIVKTVGICYTDQNMIRLTPKFTIRDWVDSEWTDYGCVDHLIFDINVPIINIGQFKLMKLT